MFITTWFDWAILKSSLTAHTFRFFWYDFMKVYSYNNVQEFSVKKEIVITCITCFVHRVMIWFLVWQPYTINSAKVIFLNQRPQSRSCKGSANICLTCDRILQEPFHFCSLSCKVHFVFPITLLGCHLRCYNILTHSFLRTAQSRTHICNCTPKTKKKFLYAYLLYSIFKIMGESHLGVDKKKCSTGFAFDKNFGV